MLRSLAVALDGTSGAAAARDLAIALAARRKASLIGIAVLDVPYLTAPEPTPIGGAYYKYRADVGRLRHAREQIDDVAGQFAELCKQPGIASRVVRLEGEPYAQIAPLLQVTDLLVIGRDTSFHFDATRGISTTVERLLKENARPVIVAPPQLPAGRDVLVAYDGSVAAARSLQLFALLGIAEGTRVHVTSIQPRTEEAGEIAGRAVEFLQLHGIDAQAHAIATESDPAETVATQAQALGAGLVVMGAYGHRGWREMLLGSATQRLLGTCPAALFVHH